MEKTIRNEVGRTAILRMFVLQGHQFRWFGCEERMEDRIVVEDWEIRCALGKIRRKAMPGIDDKCGSTA